MWWQYVLRAKGIQTPTHTQSLNLPSTHDMFAIHSKPYVKGNRPLIQLKLIWIYKHSKWRCKGKTSDLSLCDRYTISWWLSGRSWMSDCQHDSACLMLNPNEKFRRRDMSLFTRSVTGSLTEIVRSVIWESFSHYSEKRKLCPTSPIIYNSSELWTKRGSHCQNGHPTVYSTSDSWNLCVLWLIYSAKWIMNHILDSESAIFWTNQNTDKFLF